MSRTPSAALPASGSMLLTLVLAAPFTAMPAFSAEVTTWQEAVAVSETLQTRGSLTQAESVLRAALLRASEPDAVAHLYNSLGSVCQDQGRFLQAEQHYRRSLAEWEQSAPANILGLARTLNNLSSLLWDLGKVAEAESLLLRSKELNVTALGSRHPEVAAILVNLGMLRFRQKHWKEASQSYREALTILDHLLPQQRDELQLERVAKASHFLAIATTRMGHPEEARPLFARARLEWERRLHAGQLPPELLLHLANGYYYTQQPETSEALLNQAIADAERRFGPDHVNTARVLAVAATHLRQIHRNAAARQARRRAEQIVTAMPEVTMAMQTVSASELGTQPKRRSLSPAAQ